MVYLIQTDVGYQPACEDSQEMFNKGEFGRVEEWERKGVRNAKFSRKYWAMINLAAQNQDKIKYDTTKQGKDRMHYAAMLILRRGDFFGKDDAQFIPKSIAFANMKEDEFSEVYQEVLSVILRYFVPMDKEDFERELISFG